MGTINDAQFANDLGHFYQNIAQQIGNFLSATIHTSTSADYDILADEQLRILSYSNSFFSLSDAIAFENSDQYFSGITDAKEKINDAIKHVDNVNKAIAISAGVISLAAAVISKNGGNIISSIQTITSAATATASDNG